MRHWKILRPAPVSVHASLAFCCSAHTDAVNKSPKTPPPPPPFKEENAPPSLTPPPPTTHRPQAALSFCRATPSTHPWTRIKLKVYFCLQSFFFRFMLLFLLFLTISEAQKQHKRKQHTAVVPPPHPAPRTPHTTPWSTPAHPTSRSPAFWNRGKKLLPLFPLRNTTPTPSTTLPPFTKFVVLLALSYRQSSVFEFYSHERKKS